jgi:hypothetical protein
VSELLHLFILHAEHALSPVELASEHFIGLNKAVQFSSKVLILDLKHVSMSFQSFLLLHKVIVAPLVLVMQLALAFNVLFGNKESLFFLLQSDLCVTELEHAVSIALFLEVNVPAQVLILLANALVVSLERSVLSCHLRVVVLHSGKLALGIVESDLLRAEIMASEVNQLLRIFDARAHP